MKRLFACLFGILVAESAAAETCSPETFEEISFTLCEAGPSDDLRLFLKNDGENLGSFNAVDEALEAQGLRLAFAMNAGMYHRDRSPVGLYLEEGRAEGRLVTRAGPGNFGMLPNGVFCWGEGRYQIFESRRFEAETPACRYATQSGPMLVIEGELHPRFLPDSDSAYIRNGVGVSDDFSRAVFVITDERVNFHQFARIFRDHLGLPNALYFDGNISRLYAHDYGRHDGGFPMGPIVGTVVPQD